MSLSNFLDFDSVSDIVSKLKKADNDYYNNSDSKLSDAEYDKLKDSLRDADPDNPYLATVGATLPETTAWKKRKHKIPMASLNKCNTSAEFEKWCDNNEDFIVEDKLDGVSIDLEYNHGVLIAAITRGDGETGQDILNNVKNMQNVKKTLKTENSINSVFFTGNIRGEIVITKTDFHELLKHEPELKNRRNTASGLSVRQDGSHSEYLTILYYDIIEEGKDFKTELDKLERIKFLGLKTSDYSRADIGLGVVSIMEKHIASLREKKNFDIDGLVVKINSIKEQEEMGLNSAGNPLGQIAWKFPNETGITKVIDIEWSMGKGGAVTPVAIFENVFVAGAMIGRASLGSYGEFKNLKLHKGDTIEISRRNDVIPKVEKVIKTSNNPVFIAPIKCPVCGKALEIGDKKIACTNKSCTAHGLGDIMTWIRALDIKGMGDKIVEKLFEANIVTSPVDFYTADGFKVNKEMSTKVIKKINDQLEANKELPLDIFLDALNMENFGGSTTRSLIKEGYDSLEKITTLTKKELATVQGIGEIKAEQIVEGLKEKRKLIEQLLFVGVTVKKVEKKTEGGSLSGKTVLFTGKMSKGRKDMSAEAIANGATVVERVSKDLSILIVPNRAWISDKTQKAAKLGITTITEEEYRKEYIG